MFKVLIVDDEAMIRDGLTTIVDWGQFGFEVAGTAVNGTDALQKYKEITPDLMIVDIRMPGMDGLELVKKIRQEDPWQHFLILSGYADFAYAKRAIEYQVDQYILKPVEEEELAAYLRELKPKLELETLQRSRALTQAMFAAPASASALDSRMKQELARCGPCRVVLVEKADEDGWTPDQRARIDMKLAERLPSVGGRFPFVRHSQIGFVVQDGAKGQTFALSALLKELLDTTSFFAVIGPAVDNALAARSSYEAALKRIKGKFFLETGRVWAWEDTNRGALAETSGDDGIVASAHFDAATLGQKLFYAFDIANRDAVKRLIKQAGKQMADIGYQAAAVKHSFVQAFSLALSKLHAQGSLSAQLERDLSRRIVESYEQPHWTALAQHLDGLVDDFIATVERQAADILAKKMIDFIHRHYDTPLKLETMAELFHYNSAYLGKWFKSHTGENFNTYLDKVRINKAKELLLEGLKVYEVAERIGYSSADYFHSKFKKYVGLSPTEFRKKNCDLRQ